MLSTIITKFLHFKINIFTSYSIVNYENHNSWYKLAYLRIVIIIQTLLIDNKKSNLNIADNQLDIKTIEGDLSFP